MFEKYKGTLIGIIVIAIGLLFFLIMKIFGFWINPEAGPTGFCEYNNPDLFVPTPMNAWSNFYYVGAGMSILIYYDLIHDGRLSRPDSYITKDENLHYFVPYGLLVIWIGLGSFYMHAGGQGELISGHFFDVLAMNMYISSIVIFSLAILFDVKKRVFYFLLIVDFILVIILMKSNLNLPNIAGGGLFGLLAIIALTNELFIVLGLYLVIKKISYKRIF